MSLISACLFLYVGFGLGLGSVSGNPIYDGSITAFVWGARIVGIGLLVVAGLSYWGGGIAHAADLAVATLAAVGCVAVGVIWLAFGDRDGILVLLFGLLNGSAARAAWLRWRYYRVSRRFADEP